MRFENQWGRGRFLIGLGGLFVLLILLEVFVGGAFRGRRAVPEQWLVGVGISAPFIGGLIFGGTWLSRSSISPQRYPRIYRWTLGGLTGFLLLNIPIMVVAPPANWLGVVSWGRWAATLGAGTGLLMGIFEARTIERTAEAERIAVRAEEAETREKLLSYLNSILRHEVLNTANVIEGYAELLQSELDQDDTAGQTLAVIQRQATELSSVIEEVRVLVDATSGQADLEPIDITDILERELDNLSDRFDSVEIETDLPEEAVVQADELGRRVFSNLLANAVQHNNSFPPWVGVTVEKNAETVTVMIADNGPGISDADREELFELKSREGTSHGLGLGLVKTLVDRYEGTVEISQTGPEGTTFTVELPRGVSGNEKRQMDTESSEPRPE